MKKGTSMRSPLKINNISILATETLGVRGLCCVVRTGERSILIDPGIALGFSREGFLPHPVQIAVGSMIRERIVQEVHDATDIVISHFHGDHMPLVDPNPFQLGLDRVEESIRNKRVWVKSFEEESGKRYSRIHELADRVKLHPAIGRNGDGILTFAGPMDHGERGSFLGKVLITLVRFEGGLFCHASDLQLLSLPSVERVLELSPTMVIVSGPPLYLKDFMITRKEQAWNNALLMAENVPTLLMDHHLFRSEEGSLWVEELRQKTGRNILSAAETKDMPLQLLEAVRVSMYRDIPVPHEWHERFFLGKESLVPYIEQARNLYPWFAY